MKRHALLAALLAMCAFASGCARLGDNLRTVEDGLLYRSGQMRAGTLEHVIAHRGIATVINLRGGHPETAWYGDELEVCAKHGVDHHDFLWSKDRLVPPESLLGYLDVIDTARAPILVHCQGGVHRAAVAATCFLLHRGATPNEVRGQFGLFFNDAPIGGIVDLYERSTLPFDRWVETEYPALYRACEPNRATSSSSESAP